MATHERFIEHEGFPYVSLESLIELVGRMEVFITKTIDENPEADVLLPGSEAVLALLGGIFGNMRAEYVNSKDLSSDALKTIKEIYEFLGRQ